jgi:hypothetical protein
LTRQRLGQLQLQKESEGQITRSDIATLLQQGNIVLARARAHKLIQEDAAGDLLEVLQVYIGIILEHFEDLERRLVQFLRRVVHEDLTTQHQKP